MARNLHSHRGEELSFARTQAKGAQGAKETIKKPVTSWQHRGPGKLTDQP
jgi:hypothetical protein